MTAHPGTTTVHPRKRANTAMETPQTPQTPQPPPVSVSTIRYWAAAKAAAGKEQEPCRARTLAEALEQAHARPSPRKRTMTPVPDTSVHPIRLLGVRDTPLRLDEVYAAVGDAAAGGTALFVGTVRDHDGGRPVTTLEYSAHPDAESGLRRVAEKVAADFPVRALAAVHRTGRLAVGDIALIAAVSCPHRAEAFAACGRLVEELKHDVPIWKHQIFADGDEEWVGAC